ncbi:hypothetical protein MesoLjLb_35190 [Mesorhizobium sp. L-8-3]|nr:hypothetical protein MesoLjLb_35190 [Mesorhizobium sp. L-8-3]
MRQGSGRVKAAGWRKGGQRAPRRSIFREQNAFVVHRAMEDMENLDVLAARAIEDQIVAVHTTPMTGARFPGK